MKKSEETELHIYEKLGVKTFKRLIIGATKILLLPLNLVIPKDERKDFLLRTPSNYNFGSYSFEYVKRYKYMIYFNSIVHIIALGVCYPHLLETIEGSASLVASLKNAFAIALNVYCIMLQRYNYIRVNSLIERMAKRDERQKTEIKEKLKLEDSKLMEHTYKIIDKKEKETNVTFDDIINNASVEQLREYRKYLTDFQRANDRREEEYMYTELKIPMEKNKTLKLELKRNKHTNKETD